MKTYAKRMGTSVACMFSFYKQSLDQNGDMIIQEIQELDSTDSE